MSYKIRAWEKGTPLLGPYRKCSRRRFTKDHIRTEPRDLPRDRGFPSSLVRLAVVSFEGRRFASGPISTRSAIIGGRGGDAHPQIGLLLLFRSLATSCVRYPLSDQHDVPSGISCALLAERRSDEVVERIETATAGYNFFERVCVRREVVRIRYLLHL